MEQEIKTHMLDSCLYFRSEELGIACLSPDQPNIVPICATRQCKYFTPKYITISESCIEY